MQSMNFVIMCKPLSVWEQLLSMAIVLGPFVAIPLLVWLRWSPRNGRDVLGSAPVAPAGHFQRLLGFSGWLLLATLLLMLPAGVTALIHASMFFSPEGSSLPLQGWAVEPSWGYIAAAVLASSGCFIHWLRTSTSERDVLRIGARA